MPTIIRAANAGDEQALTDLAHRAKAHWGYPAACMSAWRDALTITADYLGRHRVGVAWACAGASGFYAVENPDRPDGLWSLAHLWVDPAWHGQGVGRQLFMHAAHTAREAGAAGFTIESDPHAAGFYQRLGARATGVVPAPVPGDPARVLPLLTYVWSSG